MKILITPEDIVRRCLWDSYSYYVVGSEKEAEKILKENKEFELSERDAIVIGLLKVIETDNLIHRFNDYLMYFISIRSIKEKDNFFIREKALKSSIKKFLHKFPSYWTPEVKWNNSLEDLKEYISKLEEELEGLETYKITVQNQLSEFYQINSVKKLLNFNNY